MALYFRDIIDLPTWRPNAPAPFTTAAGHCMAWDMRNSQERNSPFSYALVSASGFHAYNPYNDDWITLGSPGLAGTYGAGGCCVMHPTQGPRGTIASANSADQFTLSTALPAAVGVNQLANCGDGSGFVIRVIDNAAGGSGKTEAKEIAANTAGTTPIITLKEPLSFTPTAGAAYEIRSGRVFLLCSASAGGWKYYDLATNSFSGNLAVTNLPALATDSTMVALSEGHVPSNSTSSLGFLALITASASASGTITAGTTASLFANEYRNFQVRVVEDTATPTAAGQRRRIASHTSGTSPVFTLASNWSVTPSATAKFVVENDDDKIILFTAQTSVYTYSISANAWDTTTFTAAASAPNAGVMAFQSFGIARDTTGNARHSLIYRFRGGGVSTLDILDIAGGVNGSWTAAAEYGNRLTAYSTGASGAYDPIGNDGRYFYIKQGSSLRYQRFDARSRTLEPWAYLRFPDSTASVGGRLSFAYAFDGSDTVPFLYSLMHNQTYQFSIACHR